MSVLKLKNTYTKAIEVFQPLDPEGKRVTMYSCGPTVYSFAHIGNFRSFLMSDVLRRVLERNQYEVRQVMNITDVGHMTQDDIADATGEDKLSKAARELGWDPYKVAEYFEAAFVEDAKQLRMRNYTGDDADDKALHPRAARHVAEMLVMIQELIKRDFAYVDSTGQVYFEIGKFPEYGSLSGKVLEDLEVGARVAVSGEKRDPRDFYLWKVDEKHLMQWDPHGPEGWPDGDYEHFKELAPEGVDKRIKPGFPGWHIECSAMSRAHLGQVFDIHTGGEDNIFPHHECEIAQSYGAMGGTVPAPHGAADEGSVRKTFARYWVHGRHLLVNNRKMSKRDGTFFTVRDLLDPRGNDREDVARQLVKLGFVDGAVAANVLRYALSCNQYTQPVNFTFDLLAQARSSVERLQTRLDKLREEIEAGADSAGPASDRVLELVANAEDEFDNALNDNLNTPNALAAVFKFVGALNQMELSRADSQEALRLMESFDQVFDVLDHGKRSGLISREQVDGWLDLKSLPAKAAELAGWARTTDREALRELLAAGKLPQLDDLSPVESMDAEMIELFAAVRQAARKAKDFTQADAVRDELKKRGVAIEDTPKGLRWILE